MLEMPFHVQRVITAKLRKPELRFMSSEHRLIVFYIGVKFRESILNGIRVIERTDGHSKFRRI